MEKTGQGMDQKTATDIVVKMALARDEKTPEGQALRIVLRELRDRRGAAIELEKAVDRANAVLEGVVDEEA